ncbi:MAG TPA: hypothetical protein VFA75_03210, partial [Nevskia sp.]|nr:hypothetical protein [Nevskia sp.]
GAPLAGAFIPEARGVFRISVRADVRGLQRSLDDFARRQLPFAIAQGLNALGRKHLVPGQRELLKRKLKDPTPFTLNAIAMKAATKADPRLVIYVKDITAAYLEPFEFGGMHKLIGRGVTWFNPKHIQLNAYGNIPAGALKRLKARGDIFIGPVKTKAGWVNGIWQRPKVVRGQRRAGRYAKKGSIAPATGQLVLIVRFGDAIPVRQRLGWFTNAERIIRREFKPELERAIANAIATARR